MRDTELDLTTGETLVLQAAAEGMQAKEIAGHLFLSTHGVKYRLRRASIKLQANNTTHAVALAYRRGLIA